MAKKELWTRILQRREETTNLLKRMVNTPSVTGNQEAYRAMASIISKEMEAMGFKTDWIGVDHRKPNVVGILNPGGHPVLLLNGHTDVVPTGPHEDWEADPFGGQLDGGRLFGRGACDMKGGLAAMVTGTKVFLESEPEMKGTLILTATVDEEIGGLDGLKYLIDQGLEADFGVVCEPTDLNIVNVCKGLVWIKLTTQGKEAHGSMPEMGINAISKMINILLNLEEIPPSTLSHRILGHGTMNVGVIHAGSKPNIVPGTCEAQIDVRYLPGESHEEVLRKIQMAIEGLRIKDSHIEAKAEIVRYRIPVELPEDAEVINRISGATEKATGIRPKLRGMVSPGDMEHLFRAGISSVMFGPGSEKIAHCPNERVSIDSILLGALIYAQLFTDVLT